MVHAAQKPAPHPNFVPCKPSTARRTQRRGVSACRSSTSTSAPFTASFMTDLSSTACARREHRRRQGERSSPDDGDLGVVRQGAGRRNVPSVAELGANFARAGGLIAWVEVVVRRNASHST